MTTDIHRIAEHYSNALLHDIEMPEHARCAPVHPAIRAAQCGLMALTGQANGSAQLCPTPLAACADGVIAALNTLASNALVTNTSMNAPILASLPLLAELDGAALLGERAASYGYTRAGAVSSGGSCRLLQANDGWLALNLTRESDWDLIPAWIETETTHDWSSLAEALRILPIEYLVTRGREIGLAISEMNPTLSKVQSWFKRIFVLSRNNLPSHFNSSRSNSSPIVIDLSSLWAGPLCSQLLQILGARVIKVESTQRPDGARFGEENFFDLLNANKECVALDLQTEKGREQLRQLMLRADIVIEASRPRALRQMNIVAEDIIAKNPTLTWLSITGYGREEREENWIAYGDDAGVAAGLSQLLMEVAGEPMFCGDAIADPLTGMHAALAGWAGYLRGGGELLALSLHDVVKHCMYFNGDIDTQSLRERYRDWMGVLEKNNEIPAQPRARKASGIAAALGADTKSILAEFDIEC